MPLDQMRRYFELASHGADAAPELQALLLDQEKALQERVEQMRRHLDYVRHKIAYWRAVAARDDRAADMARELASRILAEAQRSPVSPLNNGQRRRA